jgi:hypothetical protein
MSSRSLFASGLAVACLLVGFLGIAPVANAASAGQSFPKAGESAGNNVIEIKYRGRRGLRLYPPIAPSYRYYDYPYYYSRGYYPTHIGPGFVYYGYPYRSYYWGYNRGPGSPRHQRARRD